MDKLSDIILKRLHQHKLGASAQASLVINLSDRLLEEKFNCDKSEVKTLRLKDGLLTIGVNSAVWNQELWAYQDELILKIANECGQKSVSKIHITGLNDL